MSQGARAELETIAHMYRQKRYDECIKEAKSKLKKSPKYLHLLNYQAMAYSALKKRQGSTSELCEYNKKRSITCWPLL